MNAKHQFIPRTIIQKKYDRVRAWLFLFVGATCVSALSVLMLLFPATKMVLQLPFEVAVENHALLDTPQLAAVIEVAHEEVKKDFVTEEDDGEALLLPVDRPVPVTLSIPTLDLSVGFVAPLGLLENNEVEVPSSYTEVGWYQYGPLPGEQGPAIILGHVDSVDGPAVLYPLKDIEIGDSIFVERSDGIVTRFIVEALDRPSQDEFPTEKVYGSIDYPGLRIITCTGTYIHNEQRYSHNLVVYARLVGLDFENSLSFGNEE